MQDSHHLLSGNKNLGILTFDYGPMFSGKSDTLISMYDRSCYRTDIRKEVFKPKIKGLPENLFSRRMQGEGIPAVLIPPQEPERFLDYASQLDVFIIDEISFFDPKIYEVMQILKHSGKKIYTAGLYADFTGEPFPASVRLIDIAEPHKHTAVCSIPNCNQDAEYTQLLINGEPAPYVADRNLRVKPADIHDLTARSEIYVARCFEHHIVPGKPELPFMVEFKKNKLSLEQKI